MKEEGSWPRLGLLLLSGVAVSWLVLLLPPPNDRGLPGVL